MDRLPCEIVVRILSFLPADDLQRCIALNRRTNCLIKKFWNQMQRKRMEVLRLIPDSGNNSITLSIKQHSSFRPFLQLRITPYSVGFEIENQDSCRYLIEEFAGKSVKSKPVQDRIEDFAKFILHLLDNYVAQEVLDWHDYVAVCFRIKNRKKLAEITGLDMDKLLNFLHMHNPIFERKDVEQDLYIFNGAVIESWRKLQHARFIYYEMSNTADFFQFFLKKILRQFIIIKIIAFEPIPPELNHFNMLFLPEARVQELCIFGKPDFHKYVGAPLAMYKSVYMMSCEDHDHGEISSILPKLYGVTFKAPRSCVDSKTFIDVVHSFMTHSPPMRFHWSFKVKDQLDAGFLKKFVEEKNNDKIGGHRYLKKFVYFRPFDGQKIVLRVARKPFGLACGPNVVLEFT